jgi:hypothetical protein
MKDLFKTIGAVLGTISDIFSRTISEQFRGQIQVQFQGQFIDNFRYIFRKYFKRQFQGQYQDNLPVILGHILCISISSESRMHLMKVGLGLSGTISEIIFRTI